MLVAFHARRMRSWLTPSEQKLWRVINGKQLGVWFRRQVPVGDFVADFLAPSAKLIVEVDGPYHVERSAADERRDRKLARKGYRVLRLSAELVEGSVQEAVALIRAAL